MKIQQWYLFIVLILSFPGIIMAEELEVTTTVDDNGIMGSEVFNFIGIGYKDLGKLEEAERVLLLGVEHYKSYNLAYNLAGVFIERGDKENAKLMLQIAKIRKDNSGKIVLPNKESSDDVIISKRPPHQSFTSKKIEHLIAILTKELKSYYKECEHCEHINMFLGNLYSKQGKYLQAIQYFDREITININNVSGFSSNSSMLRSLYKDKLSSQEKFKYMTSIKEAEKIVESLNILSERLIGNKEDKPEIFKNIFLAFSIFEEIKKIISRDLSIELSDDFNETLKLLDAHADFKLPKKTKIIKEMEKNDEVFQIFKTSNDVYLLLQYFAWMITYNMPTIK